MICAPEALMFDVNKKSKHPSRDFEWCVMCLRSATVSMHFFFWLRVYFVTFIMIFIYGHV